MKSHAEPAHSLPAQRAFLVQVHAHAEVAQGHLAGRVEHVVSGQATHFASPEELLAFMARVPSPCLHAVPSPRALPQHPSVTEESRAVAHAQAGAVRGKEASRCASDQQDIFYRVVFFLAAIT
jgi:hypothetical protein